MCFFFFLADDLDCITKFFVLNYLSNIFDCLDPTLLDRILILHEMKKFTNFYLDCIARNYIKTGFVGSPYSAIDLAFIRKICSHVC